MLAFGMLPTIVQVFVLRSKTLTFIVIVNWIRVSVTGSRTDIHVSWLSGLNGGPSTAHCFVPGSNVMIWPLMKPGVVAVAGLLTLSGVSLAQSPEVTVSMTPGTM